jgi:hypothetical protein
VHLQRVTMQFIYEDGEENGHFLPRGLASERIAGDRSRHVAHFLRSPGALAVNLRLEGMEMTQMPYPRES